MENKDVKDSSENSGYESPEVVEIGSAETLTLGFVNRTVGDGCDCTKYL